MESDIGCPKVESEIVTLWGLRDEEGHRGFIDGRVALGVQRQRVKLGVQRWERDIGGPEIGEGHWGSRDRQGHWGSRDRE